MLIKHDDICYSDINSTTWENLANHPIIYNTLGNHCCKSLGFVTEGIGKRSLQSSLLLLVLHRRVLERIEKLLYIHASLKSELFDQPSTVRGFAE